jgi:hypothetical protein
MLLTLGLVLFEMVLLTGWRIAGLSGKTTKSPQDTTDQTATPETTQ